MSKPVWKSRGFVIFVLFAVGTTIVSLLALLSALEQDQSLVWVLLITGFILVQIAMVLTFRGKVTNPQHHSTIQRIASNFVLTVFGLVVALLILEIGLRSHFTNSGTHEEKIMYLYSLEEIRGLQSNLVHTPYVSYVPSEQYEGHNSLGYRGAEVQIPKLADVFRIVTLGGSTTYSTGTSAEESYPAFLQNILRNQYGLNHIEVINAGFSGYTSWELLSNFVFRIPELEPDMIIIYAAINDLVVREQSSTDCYRGLNALRGLNPQRGLFVERSSPLPSSTLFRFIGINFGWLPNPTALEFAFDGVQIDCDDDPPTMNLQRRLELNEPIYYERNIRNILLLAQAQGIQPVLSSWAYNVEADRPELWRSGIAEHNAVTQRLANDLDIPYYDLANNFPVDNSMWEIDGIHMVATGTVEQAQKYAKFLTDNNLIPPPSE